MQQGRASQPGPVSNRPPVQTYLFCISHNQFIRHRQVNQFTYKDRQSLPHDHMHIHCRSGHLHCLRSKSTSEQEWPQLPPKHVYTPEEQCRFRHGQNATSCAPDKARLLYLDPVQYPVSKGSYTTLHLLK